MNARATLATGSGRPAVADLLGILQRAFERVAWRAAAAMLAVALGLVAWQAFEFLGDPYPAMTANEAYLSATIINLCMVIGIAFATLVADEVVALGAKRLPAYACALVFGSAIGAVWQSKAHQWLHLPALTNDFHLPGRIYDVPGDQYEVAVMQPAVMFFEYLTWGSILVFIYVNRRTALLAATRMNAAQVERSHAQRRTLESRLQALQARVEPQFLFDTLTQVRDLYDDDPAKGRRMLGDLITYLRAALPHLRESGSTLAREVDLASAYLRIVQGRTAEQFAFDVDIPKRALAARLPAMILLPLINRILIASRKSSGAAGPIHVVARLGGSRLRIDLSFDGRKFETADESEVPSEIRERLRALYGDGCRLGFESLGRAGICLVVEIPDESADGDHR